MNQNADIMIRGYKDKIKEMQELIEHLQSLNDLYKDTIIKFGAKINSVEVPEYSWTEFVEYPVKPMSIITHTEIQFPHITIAHRGTQDYINSLIKKALNFNVEDGR